MMRKIFYGCLVVLLSVTHLFSGNNDSAGQAGAPELLINPWARSSGWHGLNTASVRGLEAINLNPAGIAFTQKTEILFAHTRYLVGTDVTINAFGFSQVVGKNGGVIGFDVVAMGFGDIPVTTVDIPEGGIGNYSPQFLNIALAYAKKFSNSIYGGVVFRGISEGLTDVKAQGLSIDAGVQYMTGDKRDPERIKFGIALRNIGTPMHYSGDALSFKNQAPDNNYDLTVESRSLEFELPSLLNIGGSYDFRFGKQMENKQKLHRITIAANFTSNSFSQDKIGGGLEYSLKEQFMIRGGYNYEKDLMSTTNRVNAITGLAGGVTVLFPLKKNGPAVGLDYSYRTSNPFSGTHTIGARINL